MSLINPLAREISAKIVFYGPGLSGKTTTLKHIHSALKPDRRGDLLSLATEGDRTLFFDFLPVTMERVQDMPVRLQLYTVPGQIFYAGTRKLVLTGADGVVFVADSQEAARDSNRASLDDLVDNLQDMGLDLARFPHVFQFNKRDLKAGLMPVGLMNQDLNPHGAPVFATAAAEGRGVLPALHEIVRLVVQELRSRQPARKTPAFELSSNPDDNVVVQISEPPPLTPPPALGPPSTWSAPSARLSFTPLWEGADATPVESIEEHLRKNQWAAAVRKAATALAELLDGLPGATGADGHMAKAALLGLSGNEYLRFCKLASAPDAALTRQDALFALYMLVGARVKQNAL